MSRLYGVSNNESSAQPAPKRRASIKVRWWHILLIAVTVVSFLGLAWWQWTRFRSGSGTFQNLGYAFQWPLFAAFVVYAYRTGVHYENERIDAENQALDAGDDTFEYASPHEVRHGKVTKIDESFLPQRPQVNVEEFNALNVQRRRTTADGDIDVEGPGAPEPPATR